MFSGLVGLSISNTLIVLRILNNRMYNTVNRTEFYNCSSSNKNFDNLQLSCNCSRRLDLEAVKMQTKRRKAEEIQPNFFSLVRVSIITRNQCQCVLENINDRNRNGEARPSGLWLQLYWGGFGLVNRPYRVCGLDIEQYMR